MARISKAAGSASSKVAASCDKCHVSPFRRTIHLVHMLITGSDFDDLRRHLNAVFPHQQAKTQEFNNAELRSVEYVRREWGTWQEWQAKKTTPRKVAELEKWLTDTGNLA